MSLVDLHWLRVLRPHATPYPVAKPKTNLDQLVLDILMRGEVRRHKSETTRKLDHELDFRLRKKAQEEGIQSDSCFFRDQEQILPKN